MDDEPNTRLPDPRPKSEWQILADNLLNGGHHLTQWEQEFCWSFLDRGFREPTERMKDVFLRMAEDYNEDAPDDDD